MLSNEELEKQFTALDEVFYAKVEGDGYKYQLTVVSDVFLGKSIVKRQLWVYSHLKDYISSGSLHALSMKTWTENEWGKNNG